MRVTKLLQFGFNHTPFTTDKMFTIYLSEQNVLPEKASLYTTTQTPNESGSALTVHSRLRRKRKERSEEEPKYGYAYV